MNPATHFLIGWAVANSKPLERRERAAVAIAGVIPDADGLGMVAEIATRNSTHPLLWWSEYHHVLGHNLFFATFVSVASFLVTGRRWRPLGLVFASFHLHLVGDIVGARGPDGDQWPIPYLWPVNRGWQLMWDGQWALNAWPNFLITAIGLALMFYWACARG